MENLATMSRSEAEHAIRSAVQNVYLGDHIALTRILGFHKFFVDTQDVGFGGHILLDGYWESWLTLFCLRNVSQGMVAIDVGANMGYYTVLFGNNVGPNGHVIAVEPNPQAITLLRRNVDINGYSSRTQIREAACSDGSSAHARLVVPPTEPKNAHLLFDGAVSHLDSVETSCMTLDEVCGDRRVDFIKIDAEGSEEKIFLGMSRLLSRYRPVIVIEVNIARYAEPAGFIDRLHNVYGSLRYVTYEGSAVAIAKEELLSSNIGSDWLVVLSPDHPN